MKTGKDLRRGKKKGQRIVERKKWRKGRRKDKIKSIVWEWKEEGQIKNKVWERKEERQSFGTDKGHDLLCREVE